MRPISILSARPQLAARLSTQVSPLVLALFCSTVLCGCSALPAEKSSTEPTSASLSVVPASIDFQSVVVGQKNSQTVKITNVSTDAIDLRQFHVSGAGFALSNIQSALTLAPGMNTNLTVLFKPADSGAVSGSLSVLSPDLKSPITIPLSGSGEKPTPQLKLSTGSVNFGSHSVNSSAFQAISLTNTGNLTLKIDSVSALSSPFSLVGLTPGVSLAPDQRLDFQVWFRPSNVGSSSVTITVASTGLGAPLKLAVSGSANESSGGSPDPGTSHSVTLAWHASSGPVTGYHVYRGSTSGGPYNRVNDHLISVLTYNDAETDSGRFYYVVTGVASDGTESAYSNEVAVEIPTS
jgi:hypothetical protein